LKIGIFHATLPAPGRKVGGVEVFVHRLAISLVNSGNDVEVISFTEPPAGASYTHRPLFRRFPFLQEKRFRLSLLPLLLNFLDFRRYDVIHFHGDDWFYVYRPVPSLRTFYGSARFESRSATSAKRKIAQAMVYRLEQLAARLADLVIGVGQEAIELYHADAVGKLFISESRFFPGAKSKDPTFLFIGSWEGRKRGKFVVERFLNDVLPRAPNAKLFMASDVVPASDAIIDLNHPSDERLAQVLRAAWGLLSASTYEGFGIPYLEAISSGTLVITTANPGAAFVLDNGKAGFIVADAGYSRTILDVIEQPELRREYEAIGLQRAAAFSEATVIAEHLACYRQAIGKFNKRSKRV
jgi:phosphatidylinositol alpha-mannosyltransferase